MSSVCVTCLSSRVAETKSNQREKSPCVGKLKSPGTRLDPLEELKLTLIRFMGYECGSVVRDQGMT